MLAFAYLAVRVLHLFMFFLLRRTTTASACRWRFAPSVIGSTALLLVASQMEGSAQTLTWVGVLIVDYVGAILGARVRLAARSASHFAERHGLIVIVALGESIVATGLAVSGMPISWPIIVAGVLGLALAACIWWAYFDVSSIAAERVLRLSEGEARAAGARRVQLPAPPDDRRDRADGARAEGGARLVGGVHDEELADPLATLSAAALYGGVALFLFGYGVRSGRGTRSRSRASSWGSCCSR